MNCPVCRSGDTRVVDSRTAEDGSAVRRRRECNACKARFTTLEVAQLNVVKQSGVREPFDRDKVIRGVKKACQGRPVTDHQLARLASEVEATLRRSGSGDVNSHDVGVAVLEPLSKLDLVAYLRFASVYKQFESLEDFEQAIEQLRVQSRTLAHATSASL